MCEREEGEEREGVGKGGYVDGYQDKDDMVGCEGGKMMVAMCDEVGNVGGRRGQREGRRVWYPWIRPRYNLICGSRKQ